MTKFLPKPAPSSPRCNRHDLTIRHLPQKEIFWLHHVRYHESILLLAAQQTDASPLRMPYLRTLSLDHGAILTPAQIISIRHKLGLSKKNFALALGFTGNRTLVYRWETGIREPSIQTQMLMKQLLATHRSLGEG